MIPIDLRIDALDDDVISVRMNCDGEEKECRCFNIHSVKNIMAQVLLLPEGTYNVTLKIDKILVAGQTAFDGLDIISNEFVNNEQVVKFTVSIP